VSILLKALGTSGSVRTITLGGESTGFAVASGVAYGDNVIVSAELGFGFRAWIACYSCRRSSGLGFSRRRRGTI